MRVLLVSHNYLPQHAAGTEIYTAQIASGLRSRGHQVAVFTTEKDIARRPLTLSQREHQGIPVLELVNNLHYRSFRETWDFPEIDRIFAGALERLRPDLVHFNHLMYLSAGCAEAARARGAAVAFTLHDFWLHCARFGQRVRADGGLCHDLDLERCARCLAGFPFAQSGLERRLAGGVAGLRSATGIDLGPMARGARRALHSRADAAPAAGEEAARALLPEVRRRDGDLRLRLTRAVHRFLSPSRFLRERYLEWGLPAGQVEHLPTGVDPALIGGTRSPRGERIRVAFLGTLIPAKGPGLLCEAWARLPAATRERARLELVGSPRHAPGYQRELRALAERAGASLRPPIAREEVADFLRATDLLVVPSLWFENAPLVILEALATRTPLLVSRLGGMAELVEEGRSGFGFAPGDADDLAARLAELVDAPERLDALYRPPVEVPTREQHLDRLEAIYRELHADAARASER
jgi:glycosyltransferase involved in cell wall biosynthesis